MGRRKYEKIIQTILVIATLGMTILRFLLNEKGRVNPDSIRFFRSANVFPIIDNTTTPLGYPLSIKFFTFFGIDEFWSSKVIGILAFLTIIVFAYIRKFYLREAVVNGAMFSFVSIFSFSMSEALMLPFVFWMLLVARQIIIGELAGWRAVAMLTLSLILLFNIRYPAIFFFVAVILFGAQNYRKKYAKIFIKSSLLALAYVVLYKFIFIDYYNDKYLETFLEIYMNPTSRLVKEFLQGLTTTFNPFIHIANPAGGFVNYAIYTIGALNLILMIYIFKRNRLSETEKFFVISGLTGILCTFFIQYFYVIDPLDYRLLAPFSFPIWLVYLKNLFQMFGRLVNGIAVLSLLTGFAFTWLSKGNYLENRRAAQKFLKNEKLEHQKIIFYAEEETTPQKIQVAELLSTVNANIEITKNPQDTIKTTTLTAYRVLQKMKISKNQYQ